MTATSGHRTAPALQALLRDGTLSGEWVLDPGKSSVRLRTSAMWGMARVHGVFRDVTGHATVSPDGEVSGIVTVAAGSIDTDNARRDKHLRSTDFFDSDHDPHITFTTDGVRTSGQVVSVSGALTVRGRTQPLSFDAATSVRDGGEITLDAEVHVNRTDFGLRWGARMGLTSTRNAVAIHAVFSRP